jgi:TonB family protein
MVADRETSSRWSTRTIVLAAILLLHAGLFYFIATQRSRTADTDSRQAFTPVERETGGSSGSLAEARHKADAAPTDRRWRFDAFDVWPTDAVARAQTSTASIEPARGMMAEAGEEADAAAAKNALTIERWTLPEYALASARAGEEGAVYLDLRIDDDGRPVEVKLLRSSAPGRLEESAQAVVSNWRFSAPQPLARSTWAEVGLRFHAYRYELSRITEPLPDGKASAPTKPVSSAEPFRRLLGELSSSKPTFATLENAQPDFQKMRTTVIKWGRATNVRLLNPKEDSWHEYVAHREFRSASEGGTIALRWDLYDVQHEHAHARWKIAVDPYARIWAAKADTEPSEER